MSQVICQLIAVTGIAIMWWRRIGAGTTVPVVAWLPIAGIGAICLLQIVPLPPALWTKLPGREAIAQADAALGLSIWRPFSIYPQATLATLIGLLVPLTALLAMRGISTLQKRRLVQMLGVLLLLSGVLGILQTSIDQPYFFKITNRGMAVGIFANRNHQAIFLSLALPLLMLLILAHRERARRMAMVWASAAVAVAVAVATLVIALVILVNASRIGIVTFCIGAIGAAAMFLTIAPKADRVYNPVAGDRVRTVVMFGVPLVSAALVAIAFVFRDHLPGLARLSETELASEGRIQYLPPLLETARAFLPTGSGFGTFDRAYRMHEPYELLTAAYLNHAHNEAIEIIIEGGLGSAVLAAACLLLIGRRIRTAWRGGAQPFDFDMAAARCASVVVAIVLAGSITDYPLRTPALGVVGIVALVLLDNGRSAWRRR